MQSVIQVTCYHGGSLREAIITHRFALTDIHEAIRTMAQEQRNKVIINP